MVSGVEKEGVAKAAVYRIWETGKRHYCGSGRKNCKEIRSDLHDWENMNFYRLK